MPLLLGCPLHLEVPPLKCLQYGPTFREGRGGGARDAVSQDAMGRTFHVTLGERREMGKSNAMKYLFVCLFFHCMYRNLLGPP